MSSHRVPPHTPGEIDPHVDIGRIADEMAAFLGATDEDVRDAVTIQEISDRSKRSLSLFAERVVHQAGLRDQEENT